MQFLLEVMFAYLAAIGFAVLFHAPKRCLSTAGLVGTVAWTVFTICIIVDLPRVLAVFLAATAVAMSCEWLARRFRVPVTVFAISGIVPLVPGRLAYQTMYDMAQGDYLKGLESVTQTFLIAGAIAAGLVFVGSIARVLKLRGEVLDRISIIHHKK